VEEAISWFLAEVPEGIILEDDCVPSPSFFVFADEMLERYRDEPSVMHVAGYCHAPRSEPGYRFSRFAPVWGWATWRRAWKEYPGSLPTMNASRAGRLRSAFASSEELYYFVDKWAQIRSGDLDTWDYAWCYALMSRRALAVVPNQNLVRNIGVGDPRASHTTRPKTGSFESANDELAIGASPEYLLPDYDADVDFFRTAIAGRFRRVRHVKRMAKLGLIHLALREH
jgi:hypothetical protein